MSKVWSIWYCFPRDMISESHQMIAQARSSEVETNFSPGMDPWFAVRVRSNHERIAAVHLEERGYQEFAPSILVERRWSDRKKEVEQFLFPGYVFCRFDPQQRLPILTAPGVVGVVGFGKIPTPIPEHEIERIRR